MAGTTSGIEATENGSDIDLVLYQGKTVNFQVIWGGSGTPLDVTGYSARMQVRDSVASTVVRASFVSPTEITIGGADGLLTFSMSATATAALAAMVGVYDFELVSGSGTVFLVMSGKFEIKAEVTR